MTYPVALLTAVLLASSATAQEIVDPPAATPVQNILVVGQRPGPALWKVSKGDHVMWVFATYSPLPKNMAWRSQEAENALAHSQELLGEPSAGLSVGWANTFNILTAAPFLIGIRKNADGAQLQDVVPADIYLRWNELKKKYIGDDKDVEEERPMFAADRLYERALQVNGMDKGNDIAKRIEQLAKNWKIKRTNTVVEIPVDNPRGAVRDFKNAHLEDVDCFTKTVVRLESDMDGMKARANAWSSGNIEAIRKLNYPDQKQSCNAAILNSKWMGGLKGAADMHQRMQMAWLAAADKSLATNQSTFAMMPMADVLNPDGLMAALRAKGYQIDEPD